MSRSDICGFFWNDEKPPKPPKKEKVKSIPPEPVWLLPSYLPGLIHALSMQPDLFTDEELVRASCAKERLVWDIECYPNYVLIAFKSIDSGKVIYFEADDTGKTINAGKLSWVLSNFLIVDFNGNNYDIPIVSLAVAGASPEIMYDATVKIIVEEMRPNDVLRGYKVKRIKVDHIDLIELVAGDGSLKLLSGRLHVKRMQDLPFVPGTYLSFEQKAITKWYCVNDLDNTKALYIKLLPDIELREKMSLRYGMDLRSHSDAQIAEAVISSELKKMTGLKYVPRAQVNPEAQFRYKSPWFLKFETPLMNWVLETVTSTWFGLHAGGGVIMPKVINDLNVAIGNSVYNMGIGGLHSTEKTICHFADDDTLLCDFDVASFYPRIILNCGLAPAHLGRNFLIVLSKIVEERLLAKRTKDTVAADGLKIVVNGTYGKLGSKWSVFYAPDLLIQVVLTGQLSLLMLIERLELQGIPVVSANTDGVVAKCPKSKEAIMRKIVAQWQQDTKFELEETQYLALLNRDVNDYFAVKKMQDKATKEWLFIPDGCKVKGVYSEKGSNKNTILSKNPTNMICTDAVSNFLTTGKPIEQTIRESSDIRRFVSVRAVKGKNNGAVKDGVFLGKAVRWYYSTDESAKGVIVAAKSGNKIPRSEGAKPIMELPEHFPNDVDLDWYIQEAYKYLGQIGYTSAIADTEELEEDEEEELID